MPIRGSQPSRLDGLMLLWLLVAAPVLGWYLWSREQHDRAPALRRFEISGGSMAPTLLGQSELAGCDACDLVWDVQISASEEERTRMLCPHCGDPLRLVDAGGSDGSQRRGGDVVEIRPSVADASKLRRGDLVAIDWADQLHVKRIAALPGDVVELDRLHLMVNGQRLEDLLIREGVSVDLPRFLVDRDDRRRQSRWSPTGSNPGWTRTSDRQWNIGEPNETDWLVYHHRSVYHQNHPSPVWDDCPFNVTLKRKLYGVDRFQLAGETRSESTTSFEVAFWSCDGNKIASVTTSGDQVFRVSYYDAQPGENLPVSDRSPVAIRVIDGSLTFSGLAIHRWVEYRIRPHDDRDQYPLSVGPDQLFVLGDNVPISVDSRDRGTMSIENIVGLYTERKHQTRSSKSQTNSK